MSLNIQTPLPSLPHPSPAILAQSTTHQMPPDRQRRTIPGTTQNRRMPTQPLLAVSLLHREALSMPSIQQQQQQKGNKLMTKSLRHPMKM